MAPDPTTREVTARLHPIAIQLAEALARQADVRVKVVRDDEQRWLAVEETTTAIGFVEAEGDEMRVVPFRGDEECVGARPYFVRVGPAWLDGERELAVSLSKLADPADQAEIQGFLRDALEYWTGVSTHAPSGVRTPAVPPTSEAAAPNVGLPDVDFSEVVTEEAEAVETSLPEAKASVAHMGQCAVVVGLLRCTNPADLGPHGRIVRTH